MTFYQIFKFIVDIIKRSSGIGGSNTPLIEKEQTCRDEKTPILTFKLCPEIFIFEEKKIKIYSGNLQLFEKVGKDIR